MVEASDDDARLTGCDKLLVTSRRNDCCYLSNKIFSVLLAGGLATLTLSQKTMLVDYLATPEGAVNGLTYNFVFWLLFIYYSFASLDELIELYAVFFEREKGALGLLFEMNYFLGVGVAIYITIFINSSQSAVPAEYQ